MGASFDVIIVASLTCLASITLIFANEGTHGVDTALGQLSRVRRKLIYVPFKKKKKKISVYVFEIANGKTRDGRKWKVMEVISRPR